VRLRAGEWIVVIGAGLIAAFAILVGVLIYLKPPPVRYRYLESPLAQAGEAIYRREGCGACHLVFGSGATYGPALDGVGSRRSARWLEVYLREPRSGVSDRPYSLRMPAYGNLKRAELDALVEYLRALRELDANGYVVTSPAG
jgi:cbb3-type cytochrome oxidase cytochrome c subunit